MREQEERRDVGLDVVRGVALLSMYVAHTSSRSEPGTLVLVVNLLTAALFATLVGAGAGLAARRRRSLRREIAGPLVRGAALVALGLALGRAGSSIIVILVHLGLLTWLVAVLVRLPTWLVAATGVALLALAPVLQESLAGLDDRLTVEGSHWLGLLVDLTATGDTYRLSSLMGWAALGVVAARALLPLPPSRLVAAGTAALASAALLVAAARPMPYSGTHAEVLGNALLAGGVLLLGVGATRLVESRGALRLAAPGRMTLTLYTLQVLGLGLLEQRLRPGLPPHGGDVLAVLVLGSLGLALAWNLVPAARAWGRGPLEGAVERVVALGGGRRGPR